MCTAAGKQNTASASLVTLEQSILPGFIPPKPLDRLIKGMNLLADACLLQPACCIPRDCRCNTFVQV